MVDDHHTSELVAWALRDWCPHAPRHDQLREPGSSCHSQQRLYGEITDEPGGTVRRMAA